jgi:hypothetical protein
MGDSADETPWGLLGLAGTLSLCCVGTATLAGGVAVVGSTAAATTAASGATGGLGGILISGIVTAVSVFVIGIVLRWRAQDE